MSKTLSTTLLKGLDVLSAFEGASSLTLSQIAERTGLDRSTARRMALTLVEARWITQTGRAFALAPHVLRPAGAYLQAGAFGRVVQPILNAHAETLGGEISLALRDGDHAVYVAHSARPGARVSLGLTVGSTLPLDTTAIGRVLLGGDQPSQVMRGAYEPGICGLAVPVGPTHAPQAALGTTLPLALPQLEDRLDTTLATLHMAAADLHDMPGLTQPASLRQ
ncbi:helix-turn-helix domain-containing protein [Jannaschia sp. CCS1]|uniref:helix-turn-helix domain-containing protein n=1 Tax=Jannaschia sp. (strain CCS1) TaxID=290400 RepID=UPI00006BFFE7|nr:helix-turn-helix domain-containing protein [Jannaschia sp. CCS1]ABD54361.1 transcriptional regulator, IclR family [Jannaschia sp. CCS1]